MAQIMIDTDSEPIAGLMLLSRLLTDYASMRAVQDKALAEMYGASEAQPSVLTVSAPTSGTIEPGAVITDGTRVIGKVPELGADYNSPSEPDPAKLFGKFGLPSLAPVPTGTNVVPLFPASGVLGVTPGAPVTAPSVPQAPTTTQPSVSPVTTTTAGGSTLQSATTATAPTIPTNAPSAPVNGATVLNADVDSAGLPWDARIHSSSKAKKGDGTWKIKRGLEDGVAQAITAELMAAKIATPTTSAPAPNPSVPLPPATNTVPVPPGPSNLPGPAANLAPAAPTVPSPGVPAAGVVPSAPSPVARFREMMGKISAGLAAKTITQEHVKAAHESVQLAQLQQAVLHPEKIPDIERALGLA